MPQLHTWVLGSPAKGICHMWGLLGCGDLFLPTVSGSFFCFYTERTFPPSAPMACPHVDMIHVPHESPIPAEYGSHELLPTSPNPPNDDTWDSKMGDTMLPQTSLLKGQGPKNCEGPNLACPKLERC